MALDPEKLRQMSPEELAKEARELREQIWKLGIQKTTGQLDRPHVLRAAHRDLARVLTIQRERELQKQHPRKEGAGS